MFTHDLSEKIISELKDIFLDDLCSVILFGSYAKGTSRPYSDIDILIILNRKFTIWTDRRDLEIELRKRLYRTIGQVSPKTATIDELKMALDNLNPLLLNIMDSGIISDKVVKHPDYWEVVEA